MEGSTTVSEVSPDDTSSHDKENQNSSGDTSPEQLSSDSISDKIIRQCEFYFSDSNILKDQFLLNLVKASADGWIDLSIIENFRKMKQLCEDHELIKQALLQSSRLELSEDGLRIRRREPLPSWDSSVYNRSLIISDFPQNVEPTTEAIISFFEGKSYSPCLVRVLLPGRRIPPDLKRSSARAILGVQPCAIVEFDDHAKASSAVSMIQKEWPNSFVRLLSAKIKNPNGGKPKQNQPKVKKQSPSDRRPLILRSLNPPSNQTQVIHIREPIGPPSEDSLGFPAGWREQLCLEKMSLDIPPIVPEPNSTDPAHLIPNDSAIVSIITSNPASTN